jgi:hypothetical protein
MRVLPSARKHGVRNEDMVHALRLEMSSLTLQDEVIVIGPARDGTLLEVGISDDVEPRILHAMPARWRLLAYLGP